MRKAPIILASVFAAGALLSGCTLMGDYGHDERFSPVGQDMMALPFPTRLEFAHGRLIVANSGYDYSGIAVIDTTTDDIRDFHHMGVGSHVLFSLASLNDSVVVVSHIANALWTVNVATRKANKVLEYANNGFFETLLKSAGRLFLFVTHPQRTLSELFPTGSGLTASNLPGNNGTFSLAIAGNRLILGSYYRYLLMLDANTPSGGNRDTLDLGPLVGDSTVSIYGLTAHEGRIFVQLRGSDSTGVKDTAFVAVINASTLALEKTIPLRHKYPNGNPRNVNGVWYISGKDNYTANTGGVEAIDLGARSHLGLLVSNLAVGGEIFEFMPTAPGRGYVIFRILDPYTQYNSYHIQRVSF